MKRAATTQTFDQGLVMDINPIVMPNNVVSNALNATLITMNGNENALQNDMGNGRVETAYLPEGYVPLGTTELGGIIYIVSYNPLNNRCQIGSFPSPERNISSDEISQLNQVLQNSDFNWDKDKGALAYYLKKALNDDIVFNPGDKFIVYGDTISENFDHFYNPDPYKESEIESNFTKIKAHTLKLDIGTITNSGKLVKFSNLKQYTIKSKKEGQEETTLGPYHIFEYKKEEGDNYKAPDLDEYRSLISQPYNIFSSKISGSLVLIAELVQFNDFDVQIHNTFGTITESNNSHKTYTPSVTFDFSGEYPFIPYGVQCEVTLVKETKETEGAEEKSASDFKEVTDKFDFPIPETEIKKQLQKNNTSYTFTMDQLIRKQTDEQTDKPSVYKQLTEIAKKGYFDDNVREDQYTIRYKFTPCMNWGPISHLAVSGSIDLAKLGTGYIDVSQWRYYNESKKCNLTWGLQIYEEEGYQVDGVEMEFTRLTDDDKEQVTYTINKKSSYFGVFYDVLPLGESYYRLDKPLLPNKLYLVKIKVSYVKIDGSDKPAPRIFYRWLYTNAVFNTHYIDTDDFKDLCLEFSPSFNVDYKVKSTDTAQEIYGIIQQTTDKLSEEEKKTAKETKSSLSAIQTERKFSVNTEVHVGLSDDYDTFYLKATDKLCQFSLGDDFSCSSSTTIKYTDREDPNQDEYLASKDEIKETINADTDKITPAKDTGNQVLPNGTDNSDSILGKATNICEKGKIPEEKTFKDNVYSFSMTYTALQMVKAYCTKIESILSFQGKFAPLAYDKETFEKYNLEWDSSKKKWLPSRIGLFGFHEAKGAKGNVDIGLWTPDAKEEVKINAVHADEVNLNWTTEPKIADAEVQSGWTGTAIFFFHRWSYHKNGGDKEWLSYITGAGGKLDDKTIYSKPVERHQDGLRFQLAFRSDNGDQCFYPINYTTSNWKSNISINNGQSSDPVGVCRKNNIFMSLFHDFAQWLNNVYRYDEEQVEFECIIPEAIYWMDDCSYSYVVSLKMHCNGITHSTEEPVIQEGQTSIQLTLDNKKIDLTSVISEFKKKKVLEEHEDCSTLTKNVKWDLNSLDDTFKYNITNTDKTSGLQLRDEMLDKMQVSSIKAILLDYDGSTILTTVLVGGDSTLPFMRKDTLEGGKTIYRVAKATYFQPFQLQYEVNGEAVKVTKTTDYNNLHYLETQGIDLTKYFAFDKDRLLVLKNPPPSQYSFTRYAGAKKAEDGTADGYQNVRLILKYKGWD